MNLKRNHSLAKYTSWKIGGPAEYFYCPQDVEDLVKLISGWQDKPITVLGAATNVLVRDAGISGLVIYLRNGLKEIQELGDNKLRVGAGVSLNFLVKKCIDEGMVDAAFMVGIPGTLGGALKMNAGSYGDCIWSHVEEVEVINRQGKIIKKSAKEFVPAYRNISGLGTDEWFLSANLYFNGDDIILAKKQAQTYLQKRQIAQPLHLPSCGSVFRNPPEDFAARLIEESGLKGRRVGGAQISEKHANFIVNCGDARASDVESLMQEIVKVVEKKSGVRLVPEVEILGNK